MAFKNRNPNHGRQTVSWAAHKTAVRKVDTAKAQIEMLDDDLLEISKRRSPPSFTAPFGGGAIVINNLDKLLSAHAAYVRSYAGYLHLAGPYLKRIHQIKEYATRNWPLKDHSTPALSVNSPPSLSLGAAA